MNNDWAFRYVISLSDQRHLSIDALERSFVLLGHEVTIRSALQGKPISYSSFVAFDANDFASQSAASAFANALSRGLAWAGLVARVPVDLGDNDVTAWFTEEKLQTLREDGLQPLPGVHGLHVYETTGKPYYSDVGRPTITSGASPDRFIGALEQGCTINIGKRERLALGLVTQAALATEPLAKAALGLAAVEFLAGGATWSDDQRKLITALSDAAVSDRSLTRDEAKDVADAINRVRKNSVRQGLRRLLDDLGMEADWKSFSAIYDRRSAIFHGASVDQEGHWDLAHDAYDLSRRIVQTAILLNAAMVERSPPGK